MELLYAALISSFPLHHVLLGGMHIFIVLHFCSLYCFIDSVVLLFCCSVVLLFCCSVVLLFCCSVYQLNKYAGKGISIIIDWTKETCSTRICTIGMSESNVLERREKTGEKGEKGEKGEEGEGWRDKRTKNNEQDRLGSEPDV